KAVFIDLAVDVDYAGGAEVGPGEFFLAGPGEFHWFAGGFRQTGCFDGAFAGVLSAVAGAGVRYDYTDLRFRNLESLRELSSDSKWALRAGPYGELAVVPFRKGRARLE